MKKLLLLLSLVLVLSSCGANDSGRKENGEDNGKEKTEAMDSNNSKEENKNKEAKNKEKAASKKQIYASFFPVYDLTKRIVGDKMDVNLIMDIDSEPHTFELKISDMKKLSDADLIIFNGANMEIFMDDLKKVIADEKPKKAEDMFLDLSQGLTLLTSDESGDPGTINPHTWLSVKNAMIQLDTIYQKISSMDPENDEYYKKNLDMALKDFGDLEKKMEEELSKVKSKEKYFVASHAAFNYLANDYGLKQVAVTGISPDREPSAKELKDIADFVRKHNIKTIFFEGKATPKVAETLAQETGVKTDTLYTLEHLTDKEVEMGYLKLMEHNLNALVRSFNE